MNIGEIIKQRRKELGMSADTLAYKIGKSRATVFRYENGYIENMPIDILKPIAKALNTTPAHLLGWDDEEIEAAAEVQSDADRYYDHLEAERKEVIDDIINLQLTKEELLQVLDYAGFIKSRRK